MNVPSAIIMRNHFTYKHTQTNTNCICMILTANKRICYMLFSNLELVRFSNSSKNHIILSNIKK